MEHYCLFAGPIALLLYGLYVRRPAAEDIFSRPREAYGEALATYGPVIGVRRKGNLEYIVNQEYARHVLTCDRLFSFEQGSAAIMNLQPIMAFTQGTLFRDLQDFVRDGIVNRIDEIVYRIWPLFQKDTKEFIDLAADGLKSGKHPNCFEHFHNTIAETTLILLLGQDYVNEQNLLIIEDVSNGMAELTGQYQNFSMIGRYLPILWILYTWVKVMLITIPFGFLRKYGPKVWRDIDRYEEISRSRKLSPKDEPRTVLYLIVKTYMPRDGKRISAPRRLYIAVLLLCLIFAAVHTTTVVSQWVLCQLAMRPEYLAPLREELASVLEEDESGALRLTAQSLREARLMDSFIREVMRLKGDTISAMRYTTCDVPLGDAILPKGHFVTAMSTTVHENPEVFGEQPREFNGFQWAELGKEAVMTGPAHIVFGLGRFACPGRVLAVNEIKLIVMSLIARATPTLLEGRFEVSDPLNTVTQPPKGTLVFQPLEKPYLEL
ncbi:cytochrome P450 [Dichomitus squalens LYAD-421 SS1]|uniref:cytochrome P450 n=1 Tax=Dichomitus squalens (strain LYAD-421) TaxID=732165 RepID=UPI00044140A5|nr:cytochrome P450 [Dichomitus squalens LYAD-421 SS1]EJF67426.1 cytochrome P450 [Dichomitus squalens LYAD-421 SS1]